MKRVAFYLRVSTAGQTIENQRRALKAAARRNRWNVVAVYMDKGVSGSKGRDKRPGFNALCQAIARREIDELAVWSVDRLGRSIADLAVFLAELHAKGIDLYLHVQGIDTATPAGRAMFQMMGVFAEFDREMIVERVKAGQDRARAAGVKIGRPKISAAKEAEIKKALTDMQGMLSIARAKKVGVSVVQRVKREMTQ